MSLTDDDLDRISDKLKLAVADAMKEHNEAHEKLWIAINRVSSDMKVVKFVGVVAGGILASLEGLLMLFKKGGG